MLRLPRPILQTALLVLLASPAYPVDPDTDADAVPDAVDNCPVVANGPAEDRQADRDGDGIGDACECGDFDGDGWVNTTDARLIQRCAVGAIACASLCDADADGACNTSDARLVSRFAVGQLRKADLRCAARPGVAVEGPTDFVSADVSSSDDALERGDVLFTAGAPDADGAGEAERTVEEGDIYRVLADSHILNLNAYRGLQVIDFSTVESPEIVGRLPVSGSPVELYVVDDRALVLLNHWRGYYARGEGVDVDTWSGGLVLSVDLSDRKAPRLIDRARVPGTLQTSRLTRAGEQAALYVVAGGWAEWENDDGSTVWESRTVVKSFDVSDGTLAARSELDLGGSVADVQATPEVLLVARNDWTLSKSRVSLVDIRDPAGAMVAGGEVTAAGWVRSQFNLDLFRGVLRVVSAGGWNGQTNYLETFDASDLQQPKPIDRDTFGDGQQLFATLFLGNKAFFVTYFRIDPFHAFEITDAGIATEKSEFEVSGWNDFFRAVRRETRLIGIGVNDEQGLNQAVSLYDITDLTNPEPLLARAEVAASSSWSEARWDHRAFSVLEEAVAVEGPGGVLETGLVLLPFTAWNEDRQSYTGAVQIFTFSASTLTRRGVMDHGTPVRRSFLADAETTANLSETELSLFDATRPDAPAELGRVELAPNYTDVHVFGDHAARVKDSQESYGGWWGPRSELPPAIVEIVPRAEHPDTGSAVARFEIPAGADTYRVGSLLVAVDTQIVDTSQWPYTYETAIAIWDLSDPTAPSLAGGLTTDRLRPGYGYFWWPGVPGCLACDVAFPVYAGSPESAHPIEGGLVFLQRHDERELVGREEVCTTRPAATNSCWDGSGYVEGCSYPSGSITCRSLDGAEPHCTGELFRCSVEADGGRSCVPIDPGSIPTTRSCWDYDRYRYWQRFTLEVLDLTTSTAPVLADTVELPREDEGVRLLTAGSDAWVSFKRPVEVAGDARPYVKYFIRRVDLVEPASPQVGPAINVPGELLVVDGTTIYTRDLVWGERIAETAVARLELKLDAGLAVLKAKQLFEDQLVDTVLVDGAGHVLVSHRAFTPSPYLWDYRFIPYYYGGLQHLSLLDAIDLAVLSEVEVDDFAQLRHAEAGRALFQVSGGVLVFNTEDAAKPFAQAFFATRGFPRRILVDGGQILIPAGRFGIYAFDLNGFNLLSR